jgi:hypothetical protein
MDAWVKPEHDERGALERRFSLAVMPRFKRGIHGRHIQALRRVSVDGPVKPGHDGRAVFRGGAAG